MARDSWFRPADGQTLGWPRAHGRRVGYPRGLRSVEQHSDPNACAGWEPDTSRPCDGFPARWRCPLGCGRCYLFDPGTWTWSQLNIPGGSSAVALRDGRVVIWGVFYPDFTDYSCGENVDVFDPSSDAFSTITAGACLTAPLLQETADGRVLVHGGCPTKGQDSGGGNFFWIDPTALTYGYAGPEGGGAGNCGGQALLPDGDVLYAGGWFWPTINQFSSETGEFDPVHNTYSTLAALPTAMSLTGSIVGLGGVVLAFAGAGPNGLVATTLVWNAASKVWANLTSWPGGYVSDSVALDDGSALAVDYQGYLYRLFLPKSRPLLLRSWP